MLGAGGPQDTGLAALGAAAAALGHSQPTGAWPCWQQGGKQAWPPAALTVEEPSLNGRSPGPGPAEMPGLLHTNPLLLGAITQAEAETGGTHSSPACPRLLGSLVIFCQVFKRSAGGGGMGGTPMNSLRTRESAQRKSKEGGREGGSWGEIQTAGCCWARRGSREKPV